MNLQKQPNRWSCLPTAFAMVLDISVKEVITEIGHDGSEIVYPNLEEPKCRRAFHIQELIDFAISIGVSVVPIEPLPSSYIEIEEPRIITFTLSHEERM